MPPTATAPRPRKCQLYVLQSEAAPSGGSSGWVSYSWTQTRSKVVININTRGQAPFVFKRDVRFKITQAVQSPPQGRLHTEPVAKLSLGLAAADGTIVTLLAGTLAGPIEMEGAQHACTVRRNAKRAVVGLTITLEKQSPYAGGLPQLRLWPCCLQRERLAPQTAKKAPKPKSPPVSPVRFPGLLKGTLVADSKLLLLTDLPEHLLSLILAHVVAAERDSSDLGIPKPSELGARLSLVCQDFYRALRVPTETGKPAIWRSCACCVTRDLTEAKGDLKWTDEMPFVATPEFTEQWSLEGKAEFTKCRGQTHTHYMPYICSVCASEAIYCNGCGYGFCTHCWDSKAVTCESCESEFCQRFCYVATCAVCDITNCEDCNETRFCVTCGDEFCEDCRESIFCDYCEEVHCENCAVSSHCDRCNLFSCDECAKAAQARSGACSKTMRCISKS